MQITVGNRKLTVLTAVESEQPIKGGVAETLQLITEQPLTPSEIKALRENPITTDDGRTFSGYSELSSVSVLLFRANDAVQMRIEMERQNALMIEIAAKLPDDQAKAYAKFFPSMRMDGGSEIKKGSRINWGGKLMKAKRDMLDVAEFAPNVHPQFWEEL